MKSMERNGIWRESRFWVMMEMGVGVRVRLLPPRHCQGVQKQNPIVQCGAGSSVSSFISFPSNVQFHKHTAAAGFFFSHFFFFFFLLVFCVGEEEE